MIQAMGKKLRSRRGASLTFALLLFLVCAVVGSVVLAAGTAAAGRFSQQTESDRRYYAVTSAAELLKEKIPEESVTMTRTMAVTVTEGTIEVLVGHDDVIDEDIYGLESFTDVAPPEYSFDFKIGTEAAETSQKTYLKTAANCFVFGAPDPSISNAGDAWSWTPPAPALDTLPESYSVSTKLDLYEGATPGTDAESICAVDVKIAPQVNGNLVFTVSSEDYSIRLTFSPVYDQYQRDDDLPVPESDDVGAEGEEHTSNAYRIDEFHWECVSVTKGS